MRRTQAGRCERYVWDHGFTLLEVLVAFVIAALALGALTQGVADGLRSTRVAAHTEEALSRARSRLAALTVNLPPPGDSAGDDGQGFSWQSEVRLRAVTGRPRPDEDSAKRAALYSLTVVVSWTLDGGRREVALTTRRLADAPPEPP